MNLTIKTLLSTLIVLHASFAYTSNTSTNTQKNTISSSSPLTIDTSLQTLFETSFKEKPTQKKSAHIHIPFAPSTHNSQKSETFSDVSSRTSALNSSPISSQNLDNFALFYFEKDTRKTSPAATLLGYVSHVAK
jgi:hypothetical protein